MPIIDPFAGQIAGLDSPVTGGFAIAPADDADLPSATRAILVGGGGDLSVVMLDGSEVVLPGLAAGAVYPFRVARVRATGTSATGVVGLY